MKLMTPSDAYNVDMYIMIPLWEEKNQSKYYRGSNSGGVLVKFV